MVLTDLIVAFVIATVLVAVLGAGLRRQPFGAAAFVNVFFCLVVAIPLMAIVIRYV